MTRLCALVGATAGSYAGWALGALGGPLVAFVCSMVGTGVGLHYGRRVGRHYEG